MGEKLTGAVSWSSHQYTLQNLFLLFDTYSAKNQLETESLSGHSSKAKYIIWFWWDSIITALCLDLKLETNELH